MPPAIPQESADMSSNREARYRIDAAHRLIERVDELGEEAVVTHGIQLLIGAAEFLELP